MTRCKEKDCVYKQGMTFRLGCWCNRNSSLIAENLMLGNAPDNYKQMDKLDYKILVSKRD
jgi:hypothetical protein